jgi:hypothetical protein
MWENNAAVGGTPSLGPVRFNAGGGIGATVPGLSSTCAALNYTMFQLGARDFFTFRNDWVYDQNGTRYGFAGNFSSHAIGLNHQFNPSFLIRPELGYYRSYNSTAFDNGQQPYLLMLGCDVIYRF